MNLNARGSLKVGMMACAFLVVAACGPHGSGGNTGDGNSTMIGNGNSIVPNPNNPNTGNPNSIGNSNNTGPTGASSVMAVDAGKTDTMTFAAFYQDKTQTAKQFSFGLFSYDYCAWSAAHGPSAYPKNEPFESLGFYMPGDANGDALKPGTYNVGTDILAANIGFTGYTQNCNSSWPQVVSGTVTISTVTATSVTGSVNLVLKDFDAAGSPGTIKGNFTTAPCSTVGTAPANDPDACPVGGSSSSSSSTGTAGSSTTGTATAGATGSATAGTTAGGATAGSATAGTTN